MKFNELYNKKSLSVDQLINPQLISIQNHALVQEDWSASMVYDTHRIYPCCVCNSPTSWRVFASNTEMMACSQECADKLLKDLSELEKSDGSKELSQLVEKLESSDDPQLNTPVSSF